MKNAIPVRLIPEPKKLMTNKEESNILVNIVHILADSIVVLKILVNIVHILVDSIVVLKILVNIVHILVDSIVTLKIRIFV